MNINQLKELIKQVVKEESDYQQLFKHMLDKTGKSLGDMSDAEKKAFFNAIDKAAKAKSEGRLTGLPEELTYKQKQLDVDKDGEIEGSDLAKLRASKNEARDSKGNEFPEYDDVKAAVKKVIQSDVIEKMLRNKVAAYLQKERGFAGADNTKSGRLFDKVINDLLKEGMSEEKKK